MKEKCPGLPDWEALNDCAEAFATPETLPSGRYLGGPVTWGGYDDERAEALGLDYEVVHAGTDAALFAELESAYQRKAPWLGWIYTPHWAPIKFEGEWVEFPPTRTPATRTRAGAQIGYGLRLRQAAWLDQEGRLEGRRGEVAVRLRGDPRFQDRQPTMGGLIAAVDLEGREVAEVVQEWLDANQMSGSPGPPVPGETSRAPAPSAGEATHTRSCGLALRERYFLGTPARNSASRSA